MDRKTTYVSEDVQYFLARIRGFEKKYGMESWLFHLHYEDENGRKELVGYNGRPSVDYSEWSFLYEHFNSQMTQILYESPPPGVNDADQQEPERCSGFCFIGGNM